MDTSQYTLSVEIPYNLTIVSSPNYDHDHCFKVGKTVISGKVVSYYNNGNKLSEDSYRNCKLHGTSIGWYKSGSKMYEKPYEDGNLNGLVVILHPNGQKLGERIYKDGK